MLNMIFEYNNDFLNFKIMNSDSFLTYFSLSPIMVLVLQLLCCSFLQTQSMFSSLKL
jgi:hypothetical protein